jgi:bifunctional DNA-binding transcriptional regulator/antitoxin component of YhaV-PrlF toxin-antitoxin module
VYKNLPVRRVDSRGRFTIPAHIRDVFEVEGADLEILTEGDLIVLRKAEPPTKRPTIFDGRKGTSGCNYCICSSCTGWGCPWVPQTQRHKWVIGLRSPPRCGRCSERIHDCDFYTPRKRKRFYYLKKKRVPTRHSIVMGELRELKGLITKMGKK